MNGSHICFRTKFSSKFNFLDNEEKTEKDAHDGKGEEIIS